MKSELNGWLKNLVLACTLISSTQAYAQGSRGGGQIVRTAQGTELRDMVDPGVCSWTAGTSLYRQYPQIETALNLLQKYDWYLGFALKREIKIISYCTLQVALRKPRMSDDPGISIYSAPQSDMAAVRILDAPEVYLNEAAVASLAPARIPSLFIHEALHTYFAENLPGRQMKLMSVVKMISKIADGVPVSKEDFDASLKRNEISFNHTILSADQRTFLEYALSVTSDRKKAILSKQVTAAQLLSKRNYDFVTKLNTGDESYLNSIQNDLPGGLFGDICDDSLVLQELLNQTTEYFNIGLVCLAQSSESSLSLEQATAKAFLSNFYRRLGNVHIMALNGRVNVSPGLELLSTNASSGPRLRYILDLRAVTQTTAEDLNGDAKQYFSIVLELAKSQTTPDWITTLLGGGSFAHAFNSKVLQSAVMNLPSLGIEHDQQNILKLNYIPFFYQAFLQSLIDQLATQSGENDEVLDDKASALVNTINSLNLGFNVNLKN